MDPIAHAALGAAACAVSNYQYRRFVGAGCSPLLASFVNAFGGGVLLLLLIGIPTSTGVNLETTLLLATAGVLWSAQLFFYIAALRHNDLAVSGLLDCLRLVVLFCAGVLLFDEAVTGRKIAGVCTICVAILWGADIRRNGFAPGVRLNILSMLCGAAAIVVEKYLTAKVDTQLVMLNGFFTPGLIYMALKGREIAGGLRRAGAEERSFLIWSTIVLAFCWFQVITAFSAGSLSVTMSIYQSYIIGNLILGVVLLNERTDLMRRSAACILCLIGIVLVTG